jgi:hypothetical protein
MKASIDQKRRIGLKGSSENRVFSEQYKRLVRHFARSEADEEYLGKKIGLYWDGLRRFSEGDFLLVVDALIKESRFFPRVADFYLKFTELGLSGGVMTMTTDEEEERTKAKEREDFDRMEREIQALTDEELTRLDRIVEKRWTMMKKESRWWNIARMIVYRERQRKDMTNEL